ncbi:hypothetical protein V2J09_008193 [Rumex salicifolius]
MDKLEKCRANYTPLTPIDFLKRAAVFYASRTSIVYGATTRFTWSDTYLRCLRLSSALRSLNLNKNDVMHFAVPISGGVLNAVNTRLDANTVKSILHHCSAKFLFVDHQYIPLATAALRLLSLHHPESPPPTPVVIDDLDSPTGLRLGPHTYEKLILTSEPAPEDANCHVEDEWDPIAVNYTSGTTSSPKGVVYSHRGAYLSTLSLLMGWEMGPEPVYLWTLPMFHCNGWTLTWGIAARGGTNVCMRSTTASEIYRCIKFHGVTHMCCAPVVFNMLLEAKPSEAAMAETKVEILTGGAPPPPALMGKMERMGFHVVHAYGLTEATGPALVCEWQKQWNKLPQEKQWKLKARQGISVMTVAEVDVKDAATMKSVQRDGKTSGEIVLRGSGIMKGYLNDTTATGATFRDGWFWTGDVGVVHPDGYVEIKDRSKDIIISGGENISSVEVEAVLFGHPAVAEAAVVAMPHPQWGESPCAFVVAAEETAVAETGIVEYCRRNLAGYMVPKKVVFVAELPKTPTGKVKKGKLREVAKLHALSSRL